MAPQEIELDITDVAHGGVFVGRHIDAESADRGGRVVFVPDTLPGERVRVRLTETEKSSFWRGETLEVLDASPDRRPHVWAAADVTTPPERRPGGAEFGHILLSRQRELKAQVVGDALRRIGHVDLPVTIEGAHSAIGMDGAPATETDDATGWRTRVGLHVDDDGRVGPYAARSHRVIEIEDLPLAVPEIAEVATSRRFGEPGRIDFIRPADGRVRLIERRAAPRSGRRGAPRFLPADSSARETVTELAGGRPFRVAAGGFWQVHRLAAQTLTDALRAELDGLVDPAASHLDLYGGVGLLAAAIADLGGPETRITTVESDAAATEHAGENLAEWVGARAETGRVDRWLRQLAGSASAAQRARLARGVIVLDPPRAGAGREVVEQIVDLSPAHVAYVACDPVALARDLATFRTHGYESRNVRAFDLFPHSHHVEAVTLLTREDPSR